MEIDIRKIAYKINEKAQNYKMSNFQKFRTEIKGKQNNHSAIFGEKTIFDEDGEWSYAFHYGGRTEIQFNIGFEGNIFRYGIAFSLEPSFRLSDPISIFNDKILKFNDFVNENADEFDDINLWYFQNKQRSKTNKIRPITKDLIKNGTFIFIGKYIDIKQEIDYDEVLNTFDRLLEIYLFIEDERVTSDKIARVCWNINNWIKPSGRYGKSQDRKSHEFQKGYGHEEWLFDFDKLIDGYHYGFLEPIYKHWNKYSGETFNIGLYSVNCEKKTKYWIGEIKNVQVISQEECISAIKLYDKNGWLNEQIDNLKKVNAEFDNLKWWINNSNLFNVKFKPEDTFLLDTLLEIDKNDTTIRSSRYILLNRTTLPKLKNKITKTIEFTPKPPQDELENTSYERQSQRVELPHLHRIIVRELYNELVSKHGKENVSCELNTGCGTKVDIVVKENSSLKLYEIKTYNSLRTCIREGLGQILEYAYWNNNDIKISELIIVSQHKSDEETNSYLEKLKQKFNLPISYLGYVINN